MSNLKFDKNTVINKPITYVAFDCETTGLDYDKAELLSLYMRFLTRDLKVCFELELFCKPDVVFWNVDPRAMAINKIDLVSHNLKAMSYSDARQELLKTLADVVEINQSFEHRRVLEPIGHYYVFDELFCKRKLLPEWEQYINRKGLDTASSSHFLMFCDLLPEDCETNLVKLAKRFGISNDGAHDAKFDTNMTIEVLKKLRSLVVDR